MKIITPSECLSKLVHFNKKVERIQLNEYSNPRFRTADLNRLKWDIKLVQYWCSIAVHNKNKERADIIVKESSQNYLVARRLLNIN